MTPRESAQREVAAALRADDQWSAPYGVIESLRPLGAGKVRVVTFGIARLLDAELLIISPSRLELSALGPLAHSCPQQFGSVAEFKQWASSAWKEEEWRKNGEPGPEPAAPPLPDAQPEAPDVR